jgi:hypothetical protein
MDHTPRKLRREALMSVPFGSMEGLQPVEIAHEFDIDLDTLVVRNHTFTMKGIDKEEEESSGEIETDLVGEYYDVLSSQLAWEHTFYDGLRRAARNIAIVGLVTRFDHWIGRFTNRLPPEMRRQSQVSPSALINRLHDLNSYLGPGPLPVGHFEELVTARDSVIHNDSRIEWDHRGKPHRVSERYINACDELEFSEEQLAKAIEEVKTQVKWYEQRLREREAAAQKR